MNSVSLINVQIICLRNSFLLKLNILLNSNTCLQAISFKRLKTGFLESQETPQSLYSWVESSIKDSFLSLTFLSLVIWNEQHKLTLTQLLRKPSSFIAFLRSVCLRSCFRPVIESVLSFLSPSLSFCMALFFTSFFPLLRSLFFFFLYFPLFTCFCSCMDFLFGVYGFLLSIEKRLNHLFSLHVHR